MSGNEHRKEGDEPPAWLVEALRDEAARHEPDLSRIEARMRYAPRWRRPAVWIRVGGATMAAVAVILVIAAILAPEEPITQVRTTAKATHPAGPPTPATEGKGGRLAGWLSVSAGVDPASNDYWAQENLKIRLKSAVNRLAVTVSVVRTPGVESTGWWTSLPQDRFTVEATTEGGRVVYRFTLTDGHTVESGEHTFAVQFNHAKGDRSASHDTFAVEATSGGHDATARGHF